VTTPPAPSKRLPRNFVSRVNREGIGFFPARFPRTFNFHFHQFVRPRRRSYQGPTSNPHPVPRVSFAFYHENRGWPLHAVGRVYSGPEPPQWMTGRDGSPRRRADGTSTTEHMACPMESSLERSFYANQNNRADKTGVPGMPCPYSVRRISPTHEITTAIYYGIPGRRTFRHSKKIRWMREPAGTARAAPS